MLINKQWWRGVLVLALVFMPAVAYADSASSPNYQVDQTFFGTGGQLENCDTAPGDYCARITIGELTIGNTGSTNYQAYAGFNTTDEPFLEVFITAANIDLGYLSDTGTSVANAQFYVRAWQAGSYVVRTESDPPTSTDAGAHQLATMAGVAPSPGTEQFGINLVANTCPAQIANPPCNNPFGANPLQLPDGTFSFGYAATGYNTANSYRYNKGDIVARSDSSTSVTTYTVSYVFNINPATPAGQYNFTHDLVTTATY